MNARAAFVPGAVVWLAASLAYALTPISNVPALETRVHRELATRRALISRHGQVLSGQQRVDHFGLSLEHSGCLVLVGASIGSGTVRLAVVDGAGRTAALILPNARGVEAVPYCPSSNRLDLTATISGPVEFAIALGGPR